MKSDTPILMFGGTAMFCLCLPTYTNGSAATATTRVIDGIKDKVARSESIHGPTIRELDNTFLEYGHENWDGEGAIPLKPEIRPQAMTFLKKCLEVFPAPCFSVTPTGSLIFEWIVTPDRRFMVNLSGRENIAYAGLFGKGDNVHGTQVYLRDIPSEIFNNLKRLFRQ